ncbi:hypothetical protein D3C73_1359000 [compost metagenome]
MRYSACLGTLPSTASTYSPAYSSITLLRASSTWWPEAADSTSLYSREIISNKTLSSLGCVVRMKDSEQPVQSCICSQITGTRLADSMALATRPS